MEKIERIMGVPTNAGLVAASKLGGFVHGGGADAVESISLCGSKVVLWNLREVVEFKGRCEKFRGIFGVLRELRNKPCGPAEAKNEGRLSLR